MNRAAAAAYRLFRRVHDRDPKRGEVVEFQAFEDTALVLGPLESLVYISVSDGKRYEHKFKASNRPVLVFSSDGQQAYILAGGYRLTDRGIEG